MCKTALLSAVQPMSMFSIHVSGPWGRMGVLVAAQPVGQAITGPAPHVCRRFHLLRSTTGQRRTRRRRPNNRIATSCSDPSGACNVLQLPPPLPAAADLSCRWVPAGSKKAAPVLGAGAPPCPGAWGLACPTGGGCPATAAGGAAAHAGPFAAGQK